MKVWIRKRRERKDIFCRGGLTEVSALTLHLLIHNSEALFSPLCEYAQGKGVS